MKKMGPIDLQDRPLQAPVPPYTLERVGPSSGEVAWIMWIG